MSTPSFPIDFSALVALTTVSSWSSDTLPGNKSHKEASFDLIQAALNAELVDYDRPMDKVGNGAVFLWDTQLDGIPGPMLEQMGSQHATLGPLVDGVLPFHAVLNKEAASYSYGMNEPLLRWVRHAPLSALGIGDPAQGAVFFSSLQKALRANTAKLELKVFMEVIAALEEREVDWKSPLQALSSFVSVALSEAMVKSGLNVMGSVMVADKEMPLWQAWSQSKNPELDEMLVRHQAVSGEDSSSLEVQKYFSHFGTFKATRSIDLKLRDKVWSHLVSRENWHEMCDENGKSALFHAIQVDPGLLRNVLDQLKDPRKKQGALTALTHHDNRGRGLWFYLLPKAKENTVTEKLIGQLIDVIGTDVALSGKGWRLVALEDFQSAERAWRLPGQEKDRFWGFRLDDAGFDEKVFYGRHIYSNAWVSPGGDEDVKEALREALRFVRSSKGILTGIDVNYEWARAAQLWQTLANASGPQWSQAKDKELEKQIENLSNSPQHFPLPVPLFHKQLKKMLASFGTKYVREAGVAEKACQLFEQLAKRTSMFETLPQVDASSAPRRPRM